MHPARAGCFSADSGHVAAVKPLRITAGPCCWLVTAQGGLYLHLSWAREVQQKRQKEAFVGNVFCLSTRFLLLTFPLSAVIVYEAFQMFSSLNWLV